jgi:hypothetical protein
LHAKDPKGKLNRANIGTAVTLSRSSSGNMKLSPFGYVAARIWESTIIVVGIVSLVSVVTPPQDLAAAAGADAASLVTAGKSLVAIHDWTSLLGPGLMPWVNGLLLGYLIYRSALVRRLMALLGLIGGPLLLASGAAVLFRLYEQISLWNFIATLPVATWEASLGIWFIAKGFTRSHQRWLGRRHPNGHETTHRAAGHQARTEGQAGRQPSLDANAESLKELAHDMRFASR